MPRGGRRVGAGRPRGSGKFGEKTRPIRVPEQMVARIQRFITAREHALPFYEGRVQAGFPSPAEDHLEETLDLSAYLIRNPSATFLVRPAGESMTGAGIFSDDILVVDRSEEPRDGAIVVAIVDGEFTVKRLMHRGGHVELRAENPAYPPIRLDDESELAIWGVVRHVIHAL